MASTIDHVYSFTAVFSDGHVIERDHNDPESDRALTSDTGSRFTDVQNYEKTSKLVEFVIHNPNQSLGVDLRDGHFEINGVPFYLHRPDRDGYKDFRVIYYRTVRHVINQESGEIEQTGLLGYACGWQTTDKDGRNVQEIVTI